MNDRQADSMNETLAGLVRRQRGLQVLTGLARGLLAGGLAAVVIAGLGVVLRAAWAQGGAWSTLWSIPACAALGALVGLLRPIDALRLARALDRAAAGEDRFASALQLADHPRRTRARLVLEDALRAVRGVSARSALPMRTPRELKLLPIPAVALAVIFWLAPGPTVSALPAPPEVAPEGWTSLHEEFRKDIENLREPRNESERELARKLDDLARMLKETPAKKDVLEKIARLKSELEKRRQASPGKNLSLRRAAAAMRSSKALKPFASELRKGDYRKASEKIKELAEKLRKNAQAMSAEDFESAAADMDRLAAETESHDELSHACKNCAGAAGSMDRDKLADALDQLSKKLEKNREDLEECDRDCKACNALDKLSERLSKCKSSSQCKDGNCNKPGCSTCNQFVKRSNKKGGLKAGRGTADKWDGGKLDPKKEQRSPALAETRERSGKTLNYKVISKDERADSALEYKDVYADFVQKAEADLALESAPLSYRDYLRKYFTAIKPSEDAPKAP